MHSKEECQYYVKISLVTSGAKIQKLFYVSSKTIDYLGKNHLKSIGAFKKPNDHFLQLSNVFFVQWYKSKMPMSSEL